jgi:TrmH family RNA methyltransferase
MEPAVSARDPRVAHAVALLREPGDRLALDGPELIEAALAEGLAIDLVLAADPAAWEHTGAPVIPAAPDALRSLGALGQPAEVVAIVHRPPPGDPAGAVLVLANITNAGNVGDICRSTAAFGSPTLAITRTTADPFSRKALRASMGATLRPSLVAAVETLHDIPGPLAAAVPRGGLAPAEIGPEVKIVLGNERTGLTDAELALCTHRVTIPALGFESLNVAAAAAILLHERR